MTRAFVGLGSNQGRRWAQLEQALAALGQIPDSTLLACSPCYWTAPWGETDQPEFLNAAAQLETKLSAQALLAAMQRIEDDLGRKRRPGRRWGPRVIDLDLLLYGHSVIDQPDLVVPHPRMQARAFVLKPLADLAPNLDVPGMGTVAELLAAVGVDGIRLAGKTGRFNNHPSAPDPGEARQTMGKG
ncbi:MAG: 2-amino-4-hydroxy-6-hydroxymethyldihydropteridine diphosphokinase [Wenzhouxiangellaceae bacterium]|nr:2-amino-4-hydroxy-6-hydroxymethyldihydropteridine diphosphokinase [Wenzhouxiangellaceae bacterium]